MIKTSTEGERVRTVAIYRTLYGSDFLGESMAAVYPYCDEIACLISREMFGGRKTINYFGHDLYLPHDIDGVGTAIQNWKDQYDTDNKIRILDNPFATRLHGQMQATVNELIIPRFNPTHVFLVEPDEVWHEDAVKALFEIARETDADEIMAAACHLFWRSYKYCSTRTNPFCLIRNLKGKRSIGPTGHALMSAGKDVKRHEDDRLKIHNFGYAASERTVFWKHIASLSFSRDLNLDSPPREEWFDEVWRPWNGVTNRRTDLCPSIGYEDAFPPARDFPSDGLPALIKERIAKNPLPEWTRLHAAERMPAQLA